MLTLFKKFADKINSYRKSSYNFKQIVKNEAKLHSKVLEVGCNVRPILYGNKNYIHDGLDPDPNIDFSESKKTFNHFYNIKLEELDVREHYDLIVLDMVYEHLEDNSITIDVLKNALTKNGKIIIHAPSNLHPFSILNQLLSQKLKLMILKVLRPWSNPGEITGWKSYYDKCNIISLKKMLKSKGFVIEKSGFEYNGSDYFAFFPPLFLFIVLYEELISFLRLSFLCSHFMVIIRHKNDDVSK